MGACTHTADPDYAGANELGPLVARLPLPPGALPTLWNDVARFKRSYLDPFPGFYHTVRRTTRWRE